MPIYDKEFGKKLEELEKAIGFLFPPADFQNVFLADLLKTAPETMSRKKIGERKVTEGDWSKLISHFRLAQFDFEAGMFEEPLEAFKGHMREIEKKAHSDTDSGKTRRDLYEISSSPLGRKLTIEIVNQTRFVRGIGGELGRDNNVILNNGDQVLLKITTPDNGFLYLFNEDFGKPITCLMPSKYATSNQVRIGEIMIPDASLYRHFPVSGPEKSSRLYAIWFAQQPELALTNRRLVDESVQEVNRSEFAELVAVAKRLYEANEGVMVGIAHYKVSER